VADRAGAVLNHVRFVEIVFFCDAERRIAFVTLLAFEIDRFEIEPVMKPVFDNAFKFRERQVAPRRCVLVVARRAILLVFRVLARKFS